MSWDGKVVIVTGGAQGIGNATCLLFVEKGAHVICGDISENAGKEICKEAETIIANKKSNGSLTFVQMDASKGEDCKKLVDTAESKFGRIDVLFNNVGIQPAESNVPIHELDEKMWDLLFTVNIKSFFWMCKYSIPIMLKNKKGCIINNASIQGINSQKSVPAYAATKGAILSLTRQLAVEYGSQNIRVNAGTIATPLGRSNTNFDYVEKNTPMKCVGEPNDVTHLVMFLASDEAKWITGQNHVVDGGVTIKGGWSEL